MNHSLIVSFSDDDDAPSPADLAKQISNLRESMQRAQAKGGKQSDIELVRMQVNWLLVCMVTTADCLQSLINLLH